MSWPEAKYILDNMQGGIAPNNMAAFSVQPIDGGVKIYFLGSGSYGLYRFPVCDGICL